MLSLLLVGSQLLLPTHAPAAAGPRTPRGGIDSCADRNSDWSLPCRPPSAGWDLRFGGDSDFPIAAWCGPLGYLSAVNDPAELRAYAAANFSQVMVSDRTSARCDDGDPSKGWRASWQFLQTEITEASELGLQSLIDTYRCLPWGGDANLGGAFQSSAWQAPYLPFVPTGINHKITLPELQWLATNIVNRSSVVGLLITDDAVDLHASERAEIEWLRQHIPELMPWANSCCDYGRGKGHPYLAQAGAPYAMPEIYRVSSQGNATQMAASLLQEYEGWTLQNQRFGLQFFPLISLLGSLDAMTPLLSSSLLSFQAMSAVAMGAKGLMWFTWCGGAWDMSKKQPTAIYTALQAINTKIRAFAEWLLLHDSYEGSFHTGWQPWGPASGAEHLPAITAHAPALDRLVQSMSTDLMVGVLTKSGDNSSVLLVVVDKRVTQALPAPASREVRIKLDASLLERVRIAAPTGDVRVDSGMVTATMVGGDGFLLLLQSSSVALVESARRLRRWNFDPASPDLRTMRTMQFATYNTKYISRPQTRFPLIGQVPDGRLTIEEMAIAGFNVVAVEAGQREAFANSLNNGMREGAMVMADVESPPDILSPSVATALLAQYSCHPAFGGAILRTGGNYSGESLRALTAVGHLMQHEAPSLFAFASADNVRGNGVEVVQKATPIAALRISSSSLPKIALQLVDLANLTGLSSANGSSAAADGSLAVQRRGVPINQQGPVCLEPCAKKAGATTSSTWKFVSNTSAGVMVQLIEQGAPSQSQCLTVTGPHATLTGGIDVRSCNDSLALQRWQFENDGSIQSSATESQLESVGVGGSRYLGVNNDQNLSGTALQMVNKFEGGKWKVVSSTSATNNDFQLVSITYGSQCAWHVNCSSEYCGDAPPLPPPSPPPQPSPPPPPLPPGPPRKSAMLVEIDSCAIDDSAATRFAVFLALALGADGLSHRGVGQCTSLDEATTLYAKAVSGWGDALLTSSLQAVASTTSFPLLTGFPTPTLVTQMDTDLVVSVLAPEMVSTGRAPPPMLLVVDSRHGPGDAPRLAKVTLNTTVVHSWTPMLGSCTLMLENAAHDSNTPGFIPQGEPGSLPVVTPGFPGYAHCTNSRLGNVLALPLRPGEGMLVQLTFFAT